MLRSTLAAAFIIIAAVGQAQQTCATASVIGLGVHTVNGISGTAPALDCSNGWGAGTYGRWYKYVAAADTAILVTTNVLGAPVVYTRFHVYTGTCATLTCVAGDALGGPNYTSEAWFHVTMGTTYYIAWDDLYGNQAFQFSVSLFDPPEGTVSFSNVVIPGIAGINGVVDMNNDGLDDVVVPGYTNFQIGYQQAGGTYTIGNFVTTPADNTASWSFAIGDWDSNGHRDLLYGGGSGATFMKANADGTAYTEISFPDYIFCQRTNFVDLNNDGNLDAFSCHDVAPNVAFINDGAGNLTFTQGGYGTTCGNYGSIFTDFTNDGAQDLFVAKCGCDPMDLMMPNNGSGMFNNIAFQQGLADSHDSWSSAWGDFDNDGDMDAFIGSSGSGVHKLIRNNGNTTFTNVTAGSGMDTFTGSSIEWTAHDFNNDGWIDILGGGALHYNNGDMTFFHDGNTPDNMAVGDLNNDGFLDVATTNGYRANNGNSNKWIRIIPVGVQSNRDGIGARVTITTASGSQIRDVRSGDGFAYMSFIGAHFGIGNDDEVQQVVITWPSGVEDVIDNPAINTTLIVQEGISTSVAEINSVGVSVIPNPVIGRLRVQGAPLNAHVIVSDAAGKEVLATRLQADGLDVDALAPGAYVLRITGSKEVFTARFVKQ